MLDTWLIFQTLAILWPAIWVIVFIRRLDAKLLRLVRTYIPIFRRHSVIANADNVSHDSSITLPSSSPSSDQELAAQGEHHADFNILLQHYASELRAITKDAFAQEFATYLQ